jgi:hypothetical protein
VPLVMNCPSLSSARRGGRGNERAHTGCRPGHAAVLDGVRLIHGLQRR